MCISKATVAYGLTVRALPLMFAADAWTRLRKTLPFFDLIFLRRRSNTLAASLGVEVVTRVPAEVWEEIRHWVVREELENSEYTFWARFVCDECGGAPILIRDVYSTLGVLTECEASEDYLYEWCRENLSEWDTNRTSEISALLSHFGLAVPCQAPIRVADDTLALDSLALVAIPSHLAKGDSEISYISADCGGDHEPDEHTIVDISLKLPPSPLKRFTRLIRFFDFEVVDASINKLCTRPEQASTLRDKGDKTKAAESSGVKNRITKEIKPRWVLLDDE